jgi:hypothetical protein
MGVYRAESSTPYSTGITVRFPNTERSAHDSLRVEIHRAQEFVGTEEERGNYFNFAYSALASLRTEISGFASLQRAKKS